jgi:hypothetical protein
MMMGTRGEMKWKIEMNMTKLHQYFLKHSYFRKGVKKVIVIIYMLRTFTRNNITLVAIVVFLILFGLFQMTRPSFLYNNDGSLREFGVGYKNKTILPLWLFAIVLGILSYTFVLYYLTYPRFD